MQSDVEHIKEDVNEIKEIVKNQDYVSRREFQKMVELAEKNDGRIDIIENQLGINNASFSGQLGKFLNRGIVVLFGGSLMMVVVYMMYVANSSQINQLKNDLMMTNEQIKAQSNLR